jgi:hypothetical protein
VRKQRSLEPHFLQGDLNEAARRRTLRVRRTGQWLPDG